MKTRAIPFALMFLLFFLLNAPAFAQVDGEEPEITEQQTDSNKAEAAPKPKKSRRNQSDFITSMLDFGVNTYFYEGGLNLPAGMSTFEQKIGKSINVNWHLLHHKIGIGSSPFSFDYGISINWSNYEFENNFRLTPNASEFTAVPSETNFRKNKLKTTFLEVPVQLVLSPENSKFYASVGGFGGVLIGSKQKLKSGEFGKENIRNSFNLNKFRYGLVGRLGFGPIGFYAQYSMTEMFRANQGPELYPFNVGVTFNPYFYAKKW
jgi:hypothetical protein